ncbi:MAG TPA: serine/threonine-protein kinase [Vicinamibacterales bacterium]|nr:serine/threonine-protein kinase [Vicinamibacterales bacterium]
MTPERWRQVNDLFHAAMQHDAAARDAFLRDRTANDPELLAEVQSLLESHHRSTGFMDLPVWKVAAELFVDDAPLAGKTIGKYHVVHEIARGGMGVVYLARDEVLDRTVALKALPAEYARDSARRERLANEARTAAKLSHRAIATVFELETSDDQLYIVSEYVPGATLRKELADGPLSGSHLLSTLVEIVSALDAAHSHNIIHRDLKPENIVRRTDGQIKVLDFGLARFMPGTDLSTVTRQTEPGIVPGTPGYIAPELFAGREADAKSDLFVFGVVAWELATGQHPFGRTARSQLARLLDLSEGHDAELRGLIPLAGLDRIVRRCMSRLPEDRYESAAALLEDLRRLQGSGVDIVAPPPPRRLWWWQFHQAVMAAVGASTPVLAWIARQWLGRPSGSLVFFAVLALATAAVTLRLNLLFTSRVNLEMLVPHRARLFPWIVGSEGALALVLLGTAAALVARGTGSETALEAMAATLVSLAIVMAASLAIIEPATTRGAGLIKEEGIRDRG